MCIRDRWKEGTFNRENLEDFFLDDFQQWLELGVDEWCNDCLLYTSDAADDLLCVDLGGRRIIKKKIK